MKLNELAPKDGSIKERRRVGRGIGSGMGKTSSKGQKGQKSRSGVAINGFEGGQMPLYQRLPKRGFSSRVNNNYAEVNLSKIQQFIDNKKLDAKGVITEEALVNAGVVRRVLDGVRLLGNGELTSKVTLNITGATKASIAAVEKAGGKVEIIDKSVAPVVRKKAKSDGTF
jgi:large subunit ribosomal protein L15